jgi:antitoxin (DNA-binding transcriptional repressor) of toxin-antitoxin stability system
MVAVMGSVRELNRNTAGVLAQVKRGEQINITERGIVIARIITPLQPALGDGRHRKAPRTDARRPGTAPRRAGQHRPLSGPTATRNVSDRPELMIYLKTSALLKVVRRDGLPVHKPGR